MTALEEVTVEGITLNAHPASACIRPCTIHAPSDHHMRDWHLHWRGDRGIFERICPHGIGHPDPDQFLFWDTLEDGQWIGVHGCDGCCVASCDGCGETEGLTWGPDPFSSEIHGCDDPLYLCASCYNASVMEI